MLPKEILSKVPPEEKDLLEKVYERLKEMGRDPKPSGGSGRGLITSRCPFHYPDNHPSFSIYYSPELKRVLFKCHAGSCGEKGTLRSLAAKLGILEKHEERKLKEEDKEGKLEFEDWKRLVEEAHKALAEPYETHPEEVLDEDNWFVERGFFKAGTPYREVLKFIRRFKLGVITDDVIEKIPKARSYAGRIIIPYLSEDGEVLTFNARAIDEALIAALRAEGYPVSLDDKYTTPSGSSKILYDPMHAEELAIEKGYIFIVEGELDTISFIHATEGTIPVVGLPGSAYKAVKPLVEKLTKHNVTFFILMDPDEGGQNHAQNLKKIIKEKGGLYAVVHLTTKNRTLYKGDINDALKEFGREELQKMILGILEQHNEIGDVYFLKNLPVILEERKRRPIYPSGFQKLDEILGGGFREGVHVIGGLTSVGKTAFALKIAENNAKETRPVLYISYEQSKVELWARLFASITKNQEYYFKIKDGDLEENYLEKVKEIGKYLKIVEGDEESLYTVDEIANLAFRMKLRSGIAPLVIIDFLQRMPIDEEHKTKSIRERIDHNITGLQTLVARDVGCPVIVLSSISRESYISTNKAPNNASESKENAVPYEKKLASFKESGGIEYTAYTLMLMYETGNDSTRGEKTIVAEVLKNRETGRLGTVEFEFDYEINEWREK